MSKTHLGIWKQVFKRNYTRESIDKAARSRNLEDLVEKKVEGSVRDACEVFDDRSRVDRYNAYLIMAKEMPGASADTLRKIRKRLGLE